MRKMLTALALAAALAAPVPGHAFQAARPTIVLVHGAFADSSSWNGVIAELADEGYAVVAAANPLRGVRNDADALRSLVASIPGPVVLVGHSYAGPVISAAAVDARNVRALVFVAAFAPERGESVARLNSLYAGSTLGSALSPPVALPGGGVDLYIDRTRYPAQFAADVPEASARAMAATQRPVAAAALEEGAPGEAWKQLPSWSIYGDKDRNIAPAAMAFMAERARSRRVVVIPGASHSLMVSHPREVADLIEEAAAAQ